MTATHARRFALGILFVWLGTLAGSDAKAQKAAETNVRVQVRVSADDDIRSAIQQALDRELRSTPGVLLVDSSPEYTISVVALTVVNQARKNVGATFSVLVTEAYADRIANFAENHLERDLREQLIKLMSGAVRPSAHWVETTSIQGIPTVCRDIIRSLKAAIIKGRVVLAQGTT